MDGMTAKGWRIEVRAAVVETSRVGAIPLTEPALQVVAVGPDGDVGGEQLDARVLPGAIRESVRRVSARWLPGLDGTCSNRLRGVLELAGIHSVAELRGYGDDDFKRIGLGPVSVREVRKLLG